MIIPPPPLALHGNMKQDRPTCRDSEDFIMVSREINDKKQ